MSAPNTQLMSAKEVGGEGWDPQDHAQPYSLLGGEKASGNRAPSGEVQGPGEKGGGGSPSRRAEAGSGGSGMHLGAPSKILWVLGGCGPRVSAGSGTGRPR